MIIKYDAVVDTNAGMPVLQSTSLVMDLSKIVGDFTLKTDKYVVDAKSILGLISLVLEKGQEITLFGKFQDADKEKVDEIINKHFHVNSSRIIGDVVGFD